MRPKPREMHGMSSPVVDTLTIQNAPMHALLQLLLERSL